MSIASNKIKVYPTAYRKNSSDPSSCLNTETNITNLKKLSKFKSLNNYSYRDGTSLIVYIQGYFFEFLEAFTEQGVVTDSFKTSVGITNTNKYGYASIFLFPDGDYGKLLQENASSNLHPIDNLSDEFVGINLIAQSTAISSVDENTIQLFDNGNIVYKNFKLSTEEIVNTQNDGEFIQGTKSIKEYFETDELKANSQITGLNMNITGTATINKEIVTNSSITTATITNATISNANITNTSVTTATITNATITNASITTETVTNSNITNATVTNATITNANVTNATLSGTMTVTGTIKNNSGKTITVPNYTTSNKDYVLSVDATGQLVWREYYNESLSSVS